MTTIVTKNGSGAPLASDLVQGELAVDLTNKRLYTEDSGGTVIEVGTSPSTIDINAGTIDGTVIGGASAAAGTFTTFTSTGIDDNATSTAITIDSSENVGIGTASTSGLKLNVLTTASDNLVARFENSHSTGSYGIAVKAGDDSGNYSADFANKSGTSLMRIRGDGNVGIGTTDTGNAGLSVSKANVSNNVYSRINGVATANEAGLQFADQNTLKWTIAKPGSSNDLIFYNHTGPSEAMRIDSSGNLLVGTTSAVSGTNPAKQYIFGNTASQSCLQVTAGSSHTGIYALGAFSTVASASGSNVALVVQSGNGSTVTANNFYVYTNGDVKNTNNSYGAISDARLKSDIVDASSQIDDIMAVQVRSYTLNSNGETHIGVVAQELEAAGMSGLVDEDEEGMKSVKYSVMYMKAIKALQEAVTRIETLEAEVAALKGA